MSLALFLVALTGVGALLGWPVLRGRSTWPAERVDATDDVARAVSSLRDLEFSRSAGVLAEADYLRLRSQLERAALVRRPDATRGVAPIGTFVVAAAIAGIVAVVVAVSLPREVGDRAPGAVVTGTGGGRLTPTTEELAAQARADPRDIPTRLALADVYLLEGKAREAIAVYQEVLALDRDNVPALNALGLILAQAGEADGALIAAERVLALRPRDADALFLKGLMLYRKEDYSGAVGAWRVYLEVGEFHPAAAMVRPLYAEARRRLGGG